MRQSREEAENYTLLSENIRYLGKKSSQGYGEIESWHIDTIENDKSVFDNGKLMRIIPAENLKLDNALIETAVIPPAYRAETMLCYAP